VKITTWTESLQEFIDACYDEMDVAMRNGSDVPAPTIGDFAMTLGIEESAARALLSACMISSFRLINKQEVKPSE
jgi:hypothetical protein